MIPFDSRNKTENLIGMSEVHFRELVTIIVKEVVKVLAEQGMISVSAFQPACSQQSASLQSSAVQQVSGSSGSGNEPQTNAWYPKPAASRSQAQSASAPGKVVLSGGPNPRESFYSLDASGLSGKEKSIVASKLVTEETVLAAWKKSADAIIVNRNTIITPLARDAAREKKILFREES